MPDRRDVLLTVDPWTAAGPGWANSGITATWRRHDADETYTETYQRADLSYDEHVLFGVALTAVTALKAAVRQRQQPKRRNACLSRP